MAELSEGRLRSRDWDDDEAGDARRIEILKGAIRQDGLVLQHLSPQLQDDPAVVLVACNQDGSALQHASAALKDDREVVLAACNQNGGALRYASAAPPG